MLTKSPFPVAPFQIIFVAADEVTTGQAGSAVVVVEVVGATVVVVVGAAVVVELELVELELVELVVELVVAIGVVELELVELVVELVVAQASSVDCPLSTQLPPFDQGQVPFWP